MSVSELLTPLPKSWANLKVNSIQSQTPITSNQSMIIGKNSTPQSIPTGASTVATFDSINTIGSGISYNAGTFTVNVTGKYLFSYSIQFPPYTAGGPIGCALDVTSPTPSNGVRAVSQLGSSQAYQFYLSGTEALSLVSGDTVEVFVFQNSGGNLNVNPSSTISVYQLS